MVHLNRNAYAQIEVPYSALQCHDNDYDGKWVLGVVEANQSAMCTFYDWKAQEQDEVNTPLGARNGS